MKNKKYIIGLILGLVILVGGGNIVSASSLCTVVSSSTQLTFDCGDNQTVMYVYTKNGDYVGVRGMWNSGALVKDYSDPNYYSLTTDTTYRTLYFDRFLSGFSPSMFSGMTYLQVKASVINDYPAFIYGENGFITGLGVLDLSNPPQLPQTGGTGISLFKTGGYQASDMLGQTATALQSTMGLNGLGKMIAIVVGISLALMLGLWINGLFGEAKKGLKDDKKLK